MTDKARFLKKKKLAAQVCSNIGPETRFFAIFSSWARLLVFLEIVYNHSLQQCLTSRKGKIDEEDFWGPHLGQRGQNQAQNYNHFHNILRLLDVLPNFPFTTSERMHGYY